MRRNERLTRDLAGGMTTMAEYRGATSCDLQPQWIAADETHEALLRGCWSHPHSITPLMVMADYLDEIGDPRARWVRIGCILWEKAMHLELSDEPLNYESMRHDMESFGVTKSPIAHRIAGMFGSLLARFAPTGDGSGRIMADTWVDARVESVNHWCWLWSLGMVDTSQAYAAWSQASAAGRQASAVGRQASAAWSQTDAAARQAYAAGRQADAVGRQASAAWSQTDAAARQAYAAGRQADAAETRVWRFAAALWAIAKSESAELLAEG